MKSYTNLEQSQKLAEILPIESADMFLALDGTQPVMSKYIDNGFVTADNTAIPCWSLAALLDQLDDVICDNNGYAYQLQIVKEGVQYYLVYEGVDDFASYDTPLFDDLIDCCYEMILVLKEKDLI